MLHVVVQYFKANFNQNLTLSIMKTNISKSCCVLNLNRGF